MSYDSENTVYATDPEVEGSVSVGDGEEYDEPYHDPQTLWFHYKVQGMLQCEIGDKYGVGQTTIFRWMDKHDIPTRGKSEAKKVSAHGTNRPWEREEWLRREYDEKGKSTKQIADEEGVSPEVIQAALHDSDNIDVRPAVKRSYESTAPNLADPEWLWEEYVEKERPGTDIAASEGVSERTFYRALDDAGIEARSVREAALVREAHKNAVPKHAVPEPETGSGDTDTEGEITEAAVGGRSYSGPATGIDISWGSNATDIDRELWVPYRRKDWVEWQYERKENSIREMADLCGVDKGTICNWMDRFGIERDPDR